MAKNNVKNQGGQDRNVSFRKRLEMINPDASFIDVGSFEHWVCIPENRLDKNVRQFGAVTLNLYEIRDWLLSYKIRSVAMESTGIYWIALYEILEAAGLEVCLVNARDLKSVKGRPKTDKLDCQWGQRLYSYGLLKASFRPPKEICAIRSLWRMRGQLVQDTSRTIQRMQKALHEMNVLLPKVVSDITGKTGMLIIKSILSGERDPVKLAHLKDRRVRANEEEIAEALRGDYRTDQIYLLSKAVEHYEFMQKQLTDFDTEVKQNLDKLDKRTEIKEATRTANAKEHRKYKKRYANAPSFDSRSMVHEVLGIDPACIPGLSSTLILGILLETGLDLSKWASKKHFCSWMGLCPNPNISAGKDLGTRTKKCANRAARHFRIGAMSLTKSHCYLGDFYRRMRARHGGAHAITATAHKLAAIFYTLVKNGESYKEIDPIEYKKAIQEIRIEHLKKRATKLGFELKPLPSKVEKMLARLENQAEV